MYLYVLYVSFCAFYLACSKLRALSACYISKISTQYMYCNASRLCVGYPPNVLIMVLLCSSLSLFFFSRMYLFVRILVPSAGLLLSPLRIPFVVARE